MEYQTCKRCSRADGYEFLVPDDVWERVAGVYKDKDLCLLCFDELAYDAGVWWDATKMSFVGKAGTVVFAKDTEDPEFTTLKNALISLQQENDQLRGQLKQV